MALKQNLTQIWTLLTRSHVFPFLKTQKYLIYFTTIVHTLSLLCHLPRKHRLVWHRASSPLRNSPLPTSLFNRVQRRRRLRKKIMDIAWAKCISVCAERYNLSVRKGPTQQPLSVQIYDLEGKLIGCGAAEQESANRVLHMEKHEDLRFVHRQSGAGGHDWDLYDEVREVNEF